LIRRLIPLLALLLAALAALPARAQNVETTLMPGKVIEGHAKDEEDCEKCHVRFDKAAMTRRCLDCHKEIAADVNGKKGYHGRLKDDECRVCHTDHQGRNAKIVLLDKDKFDHNQTDFALHEKHRDTKGDDCHRPQKKFRDAPGDCNSCHRKDDQEKGHKGELGTDCAKCHNEKNWKEVARFDHEKTKFPLLGSKHADVKCADCHLDKKYKDAPKDCNSCHKKVDQEKGHKGRYGVKCETCHNDRSWKEIRFNHDKDTKYPLHGKHHDAKCDKCHATDKPLYGQHLSSKCVACHRKDDDEKGHKGSLGDKCESCHNEKTWKTTNFDHDKDTKYPLRDKHKDAKCEACHKGGVSGKAAMEKLPQTCIGCHRKDDDEKAHKGRYGEKCETCHNEKDWKKSPFDHDKDTKYALKGKHRETKCDDCHLASLGDIYKHKLDTRCLACHRKIEQDKGHKGQLGEKCEDCHDEKQWKGVKFDHNKSKFPLTGAHIKTECMKCHMTSVFRDAKSDCYACHKEPSAGKEKQTGDVHKGALGTKCEACHNSRDWKSWDFNHGKTSFKLDGKHVEAKCKDCHQKPVERVGGKPTPARPCYSCHVEDDVHDGGFGVQCERCHSSKDFRTIRSGGGMR